MTPRAGEGGGGRRGEVGGSGGRERDNDDEREFVVRSLTIPASDTPGYPSSSPGRFDHWPAGRYPQHSRRPLVVGIPPFTQLFYYASVESAERAPALRLGVSCAGGDGDESKLVP